MIELTESDYDKEEFKGRNLIDFWGPGCAACRALKPILKEFAKESGIRVLMLNVVEEQAITEAYGINAVPTLFAVEDGMIVSKAEGFQKKAVLYELFQAVGPRTPVPSLPRE